MIDRILLILALMTLGILAHIILSFEPPAKESWYPAPQQITGYKWTA